MVEISRTHAARRSARARGSDRVGQALSDSTKSSKDTFGVSLDGFRKSLNSMKSPEDSRISIGDILTMRAHVPLALDFQISSLVKIFLEIFSEIISKIISERSPDIRRFVKTVERYSKSVLGTL